MLRGAFHVDDSNGWIQYFQTEYSSVVGREPFPRLRGDADFINLEPALTRRKIQVNALGSVHEFDLLRSHDLVRVQNLDRDAESIVTGGPHGNTDARGCLVGHGSFHLHVFKDDVLSVIGGADRQRVDGNPFAMI